MSRLLPLFLLLCSASPSLGASPTISVEPAMVVLGETGSVSVRVGGVPPGAKLAFAASFGELKEQAGSGTERRFRWTPPDSRIPAIALLLFWTGGEDGPPDVGVARLPLIGRTDLEVATEAGAEVRVQVGPRTFGPVRADPQGKAVVPIEVPPGTFDVRVLGQGSGKATEVSIPLGVPEYNPLYAILGPDPLHVEAMGWLWVFDASDFYTDKLLLSVRGGDARLVETTKRGTLFQLTPAPRSRKLTAVATAKDSEARAEVSVELAHGKPAPAPESTPPPSAVSPAIPQVVPAIFFGGFFGGGANLGLGGGLSAALRLVGPVSVEGELGLRRASMSTPIPELGELTSGIISVPLSLGLRARLLTAGAWAVDVRGGGGALPFIHSVGSTFQSTATETGVGWEGYGGVQLSHDLGPLEIFLEARGTYSPIQTPHLNAHLGGLMLSVGARRGTP
ncbi:MAG: hypothetical protein M3Y59_11385 [Myxococcota bacterium]|nr:hypothetical protein [Myxococcota bacterium]